MLYRKTQILRATLTQEIRVIVGPDLDAPPRSYRNVQLLVPDSPRVSATVDQTPESFGLNREYKLPVLSPGAQIQFKLLPDQYIVAVVGGQGIAEMSAIIEYERE